MRSSKRTRNDNVHTSEDLDQLPHLDKQNDKNTEIQLNVREILVHVQDQHRFLQQILVDRDLQIQNLRNFISEKDVEIQRLHQIIHQLETVIQNKDTNLQHLYIQ